MFGPSCLVFCCLSDLAIISLRTKELNAHTGKCIRRFAGINAYCRYFIDRK